MLPYSPPFHPPTQRLIHQGPPLPSLHPTFHLTFACKAEDPASELEGPSSQEKMGFWDTTGLCRRRDQTCFDAAT